MQETQKEAIAVALSVYIQKGNSQEQAAKLCGVSSANLSHIVNQKWECEARPDGYKVGDGIFRKVQLGLGLRLNVVPTENFRAITATLAKAKNEHRCIVVDGDTGAGKTLASEEYRRNTASSGTYLVTSTTRMSAQDFIERLAVAVGLSLAKGGSQTVALGLIAERLLRHEKPLLILDEMETGFEAKNPKAIFGLVKDLQRETAGRLGIVMLGAGIWSKLQEKVKWNSGSFPQLVSRFEQVPPVLLGQGIGKEDEELVAQAFGLGGRKGLRVALEQCGDQRPCKNYRDLIGRLEEMQTVAGIVEKQAA